MTVPADKREDLRVYRVRRCKTCDQKFSSIEILLPDLRALEQQAGSAANGVSLGPLPSSPTAPLIDIEQELEGLLTPSLEALEEVLTSDSDLPKAKVDTARWIVADRREYRRNLAETPGAEDSQDPAIAELAQILSLVPAEADRLATGDAS